MMTSLLQSRAKQLGTLECDESDPLLVPVFGYLVASHNEARDF